MATLKTRFPNPAFPLLERFALKDAALARALVWWVGIAFLTFAGWTILQFATPHIIGHDGYYHIKIADVMRRAGLAGLRLDFIWLPLTILAPNAFADHHYLYHILLIPFTFIDLTLGAKLASIVFPALTFLTIAWSLRRQHVFGAFAWTLALFLLSDPFLFRLAMPRAQALSLLVLIVGIQWMLDGKERRLALLAFVYVWLYNAFLLLPLCAVLYAVAVFVAERRLAWRVVLYVGIGTTLGFVLHPYTPNNILFTFQHLYPKFLQQLGYAEGFNTTASVGSEWSPYQTWTLVKNSGPALALFALGALGLGMRAKRMNTAELTWFLCALVFGVLLAQARRFIEYYPAFALMFCAVIWSDTLRAAWQNHSRQTRLIAVGALAAIVIVAAQFTFRSATKTIAAQPAPIFRGASQWLIANTPQGARLFQTDWDDFPQLYFFNSHNTYTLGLDPTYSELYDRELYATWVKLTRGNLKQPAETIRKKFGADYIISDLKHDAFINDARRDPNMQVVYSDNHAIVFRIR